MNIAQNAAIALARRPPAVPGGARPALRFPGTGGATVAAPAARR